MKLRNDWRLILARAWSMRWMALAGVFGFAELIMPRYIDVIPFGLFAALFIIATVGGMYARVLVQKDFK